MRDRVLTTVLVGLVLLAVQACSDDQGRAPVVSAPTPADRPSATTAPIPDSAPDWKVRRTTRADVDGDRVQEVVGWGAEHGPIRATAVLSSSGRRVSIESARGSVSWWPEAAVDLNTDGAHELVVARELSGTTPLVITLREGTLVEVGRQPRPLLADGPLAGPTRGTAYEQRWWVRGGQLLSSRSVDAFPLSSHFFDVPDRYQARVWSWSLRGDALGATRQGFWCLTGASPDPQRC